MAKVLEIKQFNYLSDIVDCDYPGDRTRHTLQKISKFLNQKLTDIKVYRLSFYDSDYAYIIGQTPNGDRLGISFSRGYEYKNIGCIPLFILSTIIDLSGNKAENG